MTEHQQVVSGSTGGRRRTRDLDAIRGALSSIRESTGIPVAMGGLVGEGHVLDLSEMLGMRTTAMHDLRVHLGAGVGGRVMATGRPIGVADYERAGAITHEYDLPVLTEGLRSMAAVPVIVGTEVRAVLYAGVHGSVRFGDRVLAQLATSARRLEQELAVNEALDSRGMEPQPGPVTVAAREDALVSERMRQTHTQLRLLAARTDDDAMREELERICSEMIEQPASPVAARLSRRELDVLTCVAQGKTNVEIATDMGIGAETVKSYLRSVMRKLDAHTRYEAVNVARRMGVLP